ncbi:hypothetical protein CD30_06105 [Ureibacillus massiliensis 4400831 = CIP 108448 = CCUG 49529]|uniref:Holin n=1 Tax=Ureibacillus massiliensis 4400831 = CIP 108448 = CCUG 49529 TaxID=1211035 RepID=A0A0A3JWL3_9BACL|nr:hypothetical protein [Ureibacillus massiliensis]KGR91387.1 hypothetical protein CD30_06105 [Ureibacillus massiliensis 4400831 = CIP 108448 = CCUG 49529]
MSGTRFNVGDIIATSITLGLVVVLIVLIIKIYSYFKLTKQNNVERLQLEKERTQILQNGMDEMKERLETIERKLNNKS